VRNRLGLGPINSALFEPDGSIRDLHLRFYSRFAAEELGLVYVGGVAVSAGGRSNRGSLVLDSGELLCRQFGRAAAIAEQAGADLVEIHGAHGYLVGAFLSPYSNLRDDEYGIIPGGRSRFLTELLEEILRQTSLPLGLRVSVVENVDGGLRLHDLASTLSHISDALAFLSVSGGVYVPERDIIIPSRKLDHMLWERHAAQLRRWLGLPVLIGGNFHGLDEVESVLARGSADGVLMVRSLLSDPGLLSKWLTGDDCDVQPCTDCKLCKYHSRGAPHVYCPLNSELVAIRRHWLKVENRRRRDT
jgi:2,4-dienoyl-CoA reductase-like NADH-dependent reductase (Old Yellow Enzyme family)